MASEPNRPLRGLAALVTGGGGGMGRAAAALLAQDGASVMIMGRTEATLIAAREELLQFAGADGDVDYFVGDALEAELVEAAVAAAEQMTGHLSIAVAGSGGSIPKRPLLMEDETSLYQQFRFNLLPSFLVIRHAAPVIARGGGGAIVCISSVVGNRPWPLASGYSAARAGMDNLVRAAAIELGPINVRVNAIRPGLVRTERTQRVFDGSNPFLAQWEHDTPLGRAGAPEDIAGGIRYLSGPESSWVTGQVFSIDGGNELAKTAYFEGTVRATFGDEAVDRALRGDPAEQASSTR